MTDDLELFKKFANEARAKPNFGTGFIDHDYKTGEWKTGKDKTIVNGRQLGADYLDVMIGRSKYDEESKRTDYRIVRVADGVPPPKREELGDLNQDYWKDGKDPWRFVRILPLFDPETHEQFVYIASSFSGYDAIGAVVGAWADNRKKHPESTEVALIEPDSREYHNKDGKKSFDPLLDIVGWVERPLSVRHIRPPAISPPTPPAIPRKNGGSRDMDDSIPF
jgi:hypothetical protein